MLTCAMCGKPLKECCDIYVEAEDTATGKDVVLCGECWDEQRAEEDYEREMFYQLAQDLEGVE